LSSGEDLPDWLDFTGGVFTATSAPADADVGVLNITVTASDTVLAVSDTFRLTVNNVNDAPDTDNADLNNLSISEADKDFIYITELDILHGVEDADGDALTLTSVFLANPADGVLTDLGDGLWKFAPNEAITTDLASYGIDIRFIVTDGFASTQGTATLDFIPEAEVKFDALSPVENDTSASNQFLLNLDFLGAEAGDKVAVYVDGVQQGNLYTLDSVDVAAKSVELAVSTPGITGGNVSIAVLDSTGSNIIQYADEVDPLTGQTWS